MNFSQFYTSNDHFTIIPAVMLALFGCAILLFDSLPGLPRPAAAQMAADFRDRWRKASPASACTASMTCLTANGISEFAGFHGSVTVDGFGIFFNWIFLVAALVVAVVSYQVPGNRRRASRRILQPDPVRAVRHVFPGHRHRPGHALHRPGADGAVLLRDGRLPAQRQALQRGRAEVSAAGRVFDRLPGVRLLRAVRDRGVHQAGRHRRRHRAARRPGTRWCSWRWPPPPSACSSRFPPRPSTCGRRTPTKARPPRSRPIFRWLRKPLRSPSCCAFSWARWPPRARCLGAAAGGGRGPHPDGRQPGRHQPDQHQAAAGLQLHLARRLHAARPGRRQRNRHQGHRGLRDGLHLHEPGRVPGAGGAAPRRTSSARTWTISPA